jgi:TrpR-related protein YerC/YecD
VLKFIDKNIKFTKDETLFMLSLVNLGAASFCLLSIIKKEDFSVSDFKSKFESDEMNFLFDAILTLKDREECYKFFEDICTINEIKALEQRLHVAKMLKQGRTYLDIAGVTGASTATISRVNRSLNYGSDGYNLVFERIEWRDK